MSVSTQKFEKYIDLYKTEQLKHEKTSKLNEILKKNKRWGFHWTKYKLSHSILKRKQSTYVQNFWGCNQKISNCY